MDARRTNLIVAANVRAAIQGTNTTPERVAEATHIPVDELTARLEGSDGFSVTELVNVGGFLHVAPSSLLKGAVA